MKIMRVVLVSMLLSTLTNADESICQKAITSSESSWPIPEFNFTQEASLKALDQLIEYNKSGRSVIDITAMDLSLLIVRGYFLKKQVIDGIPGSKSEFCKFIMESAFVPH